MTPDAEPITFDLERLHFSEPGRLEISGRWYGVRGRLFVRPTLTFTTGGARQRVLADLEHKPWAAVDGESWISVFPLQVALADAEQLELAVATDITIELSGGRKAAPGRRAVTAGADSGAVRPRIREDPVPPRPRPARTAEAERLRERLAAAEAATTRERTRREGADQSLEEERRSARQLQAEVGRLRAELELAGAVQRELQTATNALDTLRSELRQAGQDRDAATGQLREERAGTERLRDQLADADAAVRRLTRAGDESSAAAAESSAAHGTPEGEEPFPDEAAGEQSRSERSHAERARSEGARSERTAAPRAPAPLPRTERPLNPSLRSSSWTPRGLALVVILIVIAAIVLVIRSTIA